MSINPDIINLISHNMKQFEKLVAIEPVSLTEWGINEVRKTAKEVVFYDDIPSDDDEIVRRIGDADAVLLSYTSRLTSGAMKRCPGIRYVGMCCSLYSPKSANVDIIYANQAGITVTGIRDYGDEGVVEYVVSELVRLLHGFGEKPWEGQPREIGGLKVGILGLGKSGGMIADAMHFFGAEVGYFARSEKEWALQKGYRFMPLDDMLEWSDVVFCCLNRNTVLLGEEQFRRLGNHKILFNTGLSPAWEEQPMRRWIDGDNRCYCDTFGALGDDSIIGHPNVRCAGVSTGRTIQSFHRLSQKVTDNIKNYLL